VSSREREGLIARIRQIRRTADAPAARAQSTSATGREDHELVPLTDRVTHLEQLLQGLQDSVHRESKRQEERITELEARVQPSALGKALSEDARNRGL
jgi:hypothetical protein